MAVFDAKDFSDHEEVVFVSEPDVGLKAIIAVHSTALGPGLGGVRMWPYESEDAAIRDVLRLSRGMTYKAATLSVRPGAASRPSLATRCRRLPSGA